MAASSTCNVQAQSKYSLYCSVCVVYLSCEVTGIAIPVLIWYKVRKSYYGVQRTPLAW